MFTFISITFKIFISLSIAYVLLVLDDDEDKNQIQYKNLLVFTLFFSSLLSFMNVLSHSNSDFNITVGILSSCILFSLYVYFNIGNIKKYFILFSVCLFISIGYIVSSIVVFSFYLLLDKYSIYIFEYFSDNFFGNTDDNEKIDLD